MHSCILVEGVIGHEGDANKRIVDVIAGGLWVGLSLKSVVLAVERLGRITFN